MRNVTSAMLLSACMAASATAQDISMVVPAGEFTLDKTHASVIFAVDHLGFSSYHGQFTSFDATLTFDPENAAASKLTATIDATSLTVPAPPEGFLDELKGEKFLNAVAHPEMTFVSTSIELTGEKTGTVTGDFTMRGVTKPVTLEVRFNGGWAGIPGMDPNARAGFSARGTLKRSEFGMDYGLPPPGTSFGVGDEVQIIIEAEFSGPELK